MHSGLADVMGAALRERLYALVYGWHTKAPGQPPGLSSILRFTCELAIFSVGAVGLEPTLLLRTRILSPTELILMRSFSLANRA